MKWGLPQEMSVGQKLRMNYEIPPDSSVLVHIMATRIDRKLEYTATLVRNLQKNDKNLGESDVNVIIYNEK